MNSDKTAGSHAPAFEFDLWTIKSLDSAPKVLELLQRSASKDQQARQRLTTWTRHEAGTKPNTLKPGETNANSAIWKYPACSVAAVSDTLERTFAIQLLPTKVARVCDFLLKIPSLQQMDQGLASSVEFCHAVREIQDAAQRLLREAPAEHPTRQLLQVYAGCSQSTFEANEDIAAQMSRTWVEDFILSHAWVFPDLRRMELGDLLRAIARRRVSETIDDVDRVLFAALTVDVPELLRLLASMPDRFPGYLVVHLVDMMYFAGRVPTSFETPQLIPPRDWHLIAYAQELCRGPRQQWRYALDYLRAAGSPAAAQYLASVADRYCTAAADDDAELVKALELLEELGLRSLGVKQCWRRAQQLRAAGDIIGCLRWACWAHAGLRGAEPASSLWSSCRSNAMELEEAKDAQLDIDGGGLISELLDTLAEEDMPGLLAALAPADLEEPWNVYPPVSLLARLAPPAVGKPLSSLPASGRLCFFSQFARCRALRQASRPASSWAPVLARLLAQGLAAPSVARLVLKDDLAPVLEEDPPPLEANDVLLLMRLAQTSMDWQEISQVGSKELEDLNRLLGVCLSRAILRGPGRFGAAVSAVPVSWHPASALLMA
ncbi:unnamed protein product [Polarella glacialis]|uniref:Nuclear pore complex protein Nup85 n=1 Tax=Polarella glacialis TaxID=89957 RepID=A0A813GMB7_POLGL|nr:unnamed protein product [Polarella glacialis]